MNRIIAISLVASPVVWTAATLLAGDEIPPTKEVTALENVVVMAGQFPTGDQPQAVLPSSQVALTPGANADINRALQTFPGVQLVDDGNALFVRGGSSSETITRVNGLYFPSSINLNTPTGTFTGTLNAYETRHIDFAVGGFDARFGNALSGVVDLDTVGAPRSTVGTIGASLGSVSAGANLALNDRLGIRITAARNYLGPFFQLNGSPRDFSESPNGHEVSLTVATPYRKGAEIKLFVVDRQQRYSVLDPQPQVRSFYSQADKMRFGVLSWKDIFGAWSINASLGGGELNRASAANSFQQTTGFKHQQFSTVLTYRGSEWITFSTGFDALHGTSPIHDYIAPSATSGGGTADFNIHHTQWGAFAKTDVALAQNLRAVFSARLDSSTLTHEETIDPRISIAWEPKKKLTFSLAAGIYHQIPTPYNFIDFYKGTVVTRPAMRDQQVIAGMQIGKGTRMVRWEVYAKKYANLVSLDRNYIPVGGGHGHVEGSDIFIKYPLPAGIGSRLTYGFVNTYRTDPNTGRSAPAAFDIHHSVSVIFDKTIKGWTVGASWRWASGKPLTPIIGGADDGSGGFQPIYGAPYSDRLPPIQKLDLMFSRYWRTSERTNLVTYLTLSNALNRANVYTYGYSNDYSQRYPVSSLYNRSIFVGVTLQFH